MIVIQENVKTGFSWDSAILESVVLTLTLNRSNEGT